MISKVALPAAVSLLGIYVIVSILTSGANAMAEAMWYLAALGLIIGLVSAKAGMMFVLLCGNYLDLMKRFLVVGGNFSFNDVVRTLAVAPVAMTAVYATVLVRNIRLGNALPKGRILLSIFISAAVIGRSFAAGEPLNSVLQSTANSALYVAMIAFAGMVYRNLEEQHQLWRGSLLLFIPVVLYGLQQLGNGYNAIETQYALSGFTTIVNPLIHPSEVEYKRIFSTMNSSVAYTLVGTILSLYALIFGFGRGHLGRTAGILFGIVCLGSHIPGAGRTGWAVAILSFGCYFIFKYRFSTIAAYIVSTVSVLLFLFNAKVIGEKLVEWADLSVSSDFAERAITMGTFTSRTQGISEWFTNERYFSLFGLPKEIGLDSGAHDMIGQIYVSTGAVGLFLTVAFGAVILYHLHKNLLKMTSPDEKKLATFYMANIFGQLLGGIFSGSQLHVFPVNVYFWLMVGLLFQLIESNKRVTEPYAFISATKGEIGMASDP